MANVKDLGVVLQFLLSSPTSIFFTLRKASLFPSLPFEKMSFASSYLLLSHSTLSYSIPFSLAFRSSKKSLFVSNSFALRNLTTCSCARSNETSSFLVDERPLRRFPFNSPSTLMSLSDSSFQSTSSCSWLPSDISMWKHILNIRKKTAFVAKKGDSNPVIDRNNVFDKNRNNMGIGEHRSANFLLNNIECIFDVNGKNKNNDIDSMKTSADNIIYDSSAHESTNDVDNRIRSVSNKNDKKKSDKSLRNCKNPYILVQSLSYTSRRNYNSVENDEHVHIDDRRSCVNTRNNAACVAANKDSNYHDYGTCNSYEEENSNITDVETEGSKNKMATSDKGKESDKNYELENKNNNHQHSKGNGCIEKEPSKHYDVQCNVKDNERAHERKLRMYENIASSYYRPWRHFARSHYYY